MNEDRCNRPTPRDMFERKIRNQFSFDGAVLRALGEIRYPGKAS